MKKSVITGNIIMLAIMLIFDISYMFGGGLISKSIASIMFVGTGIINYIYCIKHKVNLKFPKWMIIALICAMLGDILLVINFYVGVALFAIGHVFYFVSYCKLERFNRKDLIYGSSIFIIALFIIWFAPFLDFGGIVMKSVCCAYALIISLMVGKAISNVIKDKKYTYMTILLGSTLFFISDLMLMLDKFGDIPGTSYLCLGTYYPGQYILAFSIFIYASTSKLRQNKYRNTLKVS